VRPTPITIVLHIVVEPLPHPNTAVHDILQFTSPVKTHVARKDPQAGKVPDRTFCERILQTISCLHSYLEYQSEIRMGSSPTPSPASAPEALPKASYVTHASALALSPLLLPAVGDEAQDARRPSIQFLPHSKAGLPRGSQKPGRAQRRMSSPPPPP
jgi:hypothetical protein